MKGFACLIICLHNQLMCDDEIKQFIENWILDDLSKPRRAISNMPICPFAKQAFEEKRVMVEILGDIELEPEVLLNVYDFHNYNIDVLVLVLKSMPPLLDSRALADKINKISLQEGIAVMLDHPDEKFEVNGVPFSNGKYPLFILQNVFHLVEKAEFLKAKTKYYDKWSLEKLCEVTSWRFPEKPKA